MHSLESHLYQSPVIKEKVKDKEFAVKLYGSLCNMQWRYKADTELWACTWRYAGSVVGQLRDDAGEDYLDFYCSGNEGVVDPDVRTVLREMGWEPVPYKEPDISRFIGD